MIRYLLDTNIVSYLVRKTYPALVHRVRVQPGDSFAISVITEAEVRVGIALAPAESKVSLLAAEYLTGVEILPWDSACAEQYAQVSARQRKLGKPLSTLDAMIAAHALAHGLVLVTNDAAFRQVKGLPLEDWTKGPRR